MMKKKKKKIHHEIDEERVNSDILSHILSRIPAKSLIEMKCISKEWHQIISSSSFIKTQLQQTNLALTGFIFQEKFTFCRDDITTISYIPVPEEEEEEETTTRKSSSDRFHQNVFSFLPEDVVVLASCKGIICCRSCLSSPHQTIYLCNPSIKEWIQLDWPDSAFDRRTQSIALTFDFDSIDNSPYFNFKLVRVKQHDQSLEEDDDTFFFTFELYSSQTGAWRKSKEICQCNGNLVKNKSIDIGGVLHWFTDSDQILTFDVENELSWLISIPIPAIEFTSVPAACIGEYEGKLHYVQVSEEGLHVWYLQDYYDFNWILTHWKSLADFELEYPHFFLNLKSRVSQRKCVETNPWMNPLGFKDGILLIKVSTYVYMYDMKNDKMTQACSFLKLNSQSMSDPAIFPLSLSLVPLSNAKLLV